MNKQAVEIMYSDLREGYAVLQGEYERLKDHCDELKKIAQNIETDKNEIWMEYREYYEKMTEMEEGYDELAIAYTNAQKEISVLKNGGNKAFLDGIKLSVSHFNQDEHVEGMAVLQRLINGGNENE